MNLPHDTETERLLLGALLVAIPKQRREMLAVVRAPWFFDTWHRDMFAAISRNYERDGVDLLKEILTPAHLERWPAAPIFLWGLCETREGDAICGLVSSWHRYAARLSAVADARLKILSLQTQLRELFDECSNRFPQLGISG